MPYHAIPKISAPPMESGLDSHNCNAKLHRHIFKILAVQIVELERRPEGRRQARELESQYVGDLPVCKGVLGIVVSVCFFRTEPFHSSGSLIVREHLVPIGRPQARHTLINNDSSHPG